MVKYSFVIPTHNRKYLLKNTLESLNYQEGFGREDYEVVIVDEGSDDNTQEFIRGINRNYNLNYIYKERSSKSCYSKTRNTGWKNTSGEIVIFLDSDMIVKSSYLSEIARTFEMDKDILLFSTRLLLPEGMSVERKDISDQSIFKRFKYSNENKDLFEVRHFLFDMMSYNMQHMVFPWLYTFSCNIALAKQSLAEVDGFDEKFTGWGAEDIDLGYRIYEKGKKVIYNYRLEGLHQYHKISDRKKYKKNLDYFTSKHPNIKKNLTKEQYDMFYSTEDELSVIKRIKTTFETVRDSGIKKGTHDIETREINIMDVKEIPEIKKQVRKLITEEDCILAVIDHVENSDFHVWIQLETYEVKNRVLYYIASRRFS